MRVRSPSCRYIETVFTYGRPACLAVVVKLQAMLQASASLHLAVLPERLSGTGVSLSDARLNRMVITCTDVLCWQQQVSACPAKQLWSHFIRQSPDIPYRLCTGATAIVQAADAAPDYKTAPSGLQWKDTSEGSGSSPAKGSSIRYDLA